MCHHRGDIPDWDRERTDGEEPDPDEEPDLPEFLNEAASDHEVLTDGGDESS